MFCSYLNMVVPIVMKVKNPVELTVPGYSDLLGVLHALAQGLPSVLLHLDVVELPAIQYRYYICYYHHYNYHCYLVYISIYLFVYLRFIYLSIYLSIYLYIYLLFLDYYIVFILLAATPAYSYPQILGHRVPTNIHKGCSKFLFIKYKQTYTCIGCRTQTLDEGW